MRRRPFIVTLLVVILLLAGAGTGVHFLRHRDESPAKLEEIESFFHELSGSGGGWTVTGQNASRRAVPTGSGWLEGIGYRRTREYQEHTYWLAHSGTHRLANLKIYREDERIVLLDVFAATRADAEELSHLLLGKFPRLQPILKRYP